MLSLQSHLQLGCDIKYETPLRWVFTILLPQILNDNPIKEATEINEQRLLIIWS